MIAGHVDSCTWKMSNLSLPNSFTWRGRSRRFLVRLFSFLLASPCLSFLHGGCTSRLGFWLREDSSRRRRGRPTGGTPSLGGGAPLLLVDARPSTLGRRTLAHLQPRGRKRSGIAATGEMKWHSTNFVIGFDFLVECLNLTI